MYTSCQKLPLLNIPEIDNQVIDLPIEKSPQILISENTLKHLHDRFEVTEIDPVHAKGKFNPIRVFNVLGWKDNASSA